MGTTVSVAARVSPLSLAARSGLATLFANKTSVHKCREGVPRAASGVPSVCLFLRGAGFLFGAN